MKLLKSLLGIEELEKRMSNVENKIKKLEKLHIARIEIIEDEGRKILGVLTKPLTTSQIAKKLGKSRSWVSSLVNKLERENKVKEAGKKGRSVLYKKA
jgi:DNA-binding transcriptional ArsR family regulator|tara:strand:+ start:1791 stop:2084 length:294 start_codon:yes stop_codon:yes gene_type:complete